MANYQIPMTGAQITDALTQLVNRVAEGWAVGSRDGNPVSTGSPYYHNNAKYYSENAQASAARAEAAVPPSTAGAVFFDRSQSLTDAQKGQVQKNIGAGNNNPNLIINGWFIVNTRGITTHTTGFGADNWTLEAGSGSATFSEDGMALTGSANSVQLRSYIPDGFLYSMLGRKLTMSIKLFSGDIISGQLTVPTSAPATQVSLGSIYATPSGVTSYTMGATWMPTTKRLMIFLRPYGGTIYIRAVKLEMGENCTLADDAMPNYNEELIRCESNNVYSSDTFANKIVTATSNRNLLDNWWFREGVINQRGFTTGTAITNGYKIMDRWILSYGSGGVDATLDAYGYTQAPHDSTSRAIIQQKFPSQVLASMNTRTITASVKLRSGTIVSGTISRAANYAQTFFDQEVDGARLVCMMTAQNYFDIESYGTGHTIISAKLEMGTVSTLYLDAAPNPAEQLAICQRYFQRIQLSTNQSTGFGFAQSATSLRFGVPIPASLRIAPSSISTYGTMLAKGNGQSLTLTTITAANVSATNTVYLVGETTGATVNEVYVLSSNNSPAWIDISADL